MTTITAPGPLLPLDAPLPAPREGTLLDAATIVTELDDRWRAGAWVNGYPAGRPQAHDPCAEGTNRAKDAENTDARPMASSFTVVIGGVCTSRSIGSDPEWYKRRLRSWFEAVESEPVERYLVAGGDGAAAYLGDQNMEQLASGATQTSVEGLAVLETEIATVGNGMIHATPGVATKWVSNGLIGLRGGKFYTGLGTLVAVGAGYVGADPYGTSGQTATREWAFASDFVQIRRGAAVDVLAADYAQSLDRASNEVTFYAERDYLLTWVGRQDASDTQHIQAGVLIDRTT